MRIEISSMIPLLLNFLTVFFIIAGAVLLWINSRASRRSRIHLAPEKPAEQTEPEQAVPELTRSTDINLNMTL
ncbi:hypothetical protein AB8Z38_34525 [Bradyrhizobium sp. LLZ17]|uniref:Uncharacterized protein n=1 Tax=Bradyrhizobium sp. LLZ17 TaxID=3239388 RepID=A0AB39XK76_9BRAD